LSDRLLGRAFPGRQTVTVSLDLDMYSHTIPAMQEEQASSSRSRLARRKRPRRPSRRFRRMDSALSPVGRRIQPLSVAAFVRRAFAESIRPAIKDLTDADLTDAY